MTITCSLLTSPAVAVRAAGAFSEPHSGGASTTAHGFRCAMQDERLDRRMHHPNAAPQWCSEGARPTATGTLGTPKMRPAFDLFPSLAPALVKGFAAQCVARGLLSQGEKGRDRASRPPLSGGAAVAQLVEQPPCERQVAGSNPCQRHQFRIGSSAVELGAHNAEVAGSNPARSTKNRPPHSGLRQPDAAQNAATININMSTARRTPQGRLNGLPRRRAETRHSPQPTAAFNPSGNGAGYSARMVRAPVTSAGARDRRASVQLSPVGKIDRWDVVLGLNDKSAPNHLAGASVPAIFRSAT